MEPKIKEAQKLFSKKQYESCIELLVQTWRENAQDVKAFVQKRNLYHGRNSHYFWNSELPELWGESLFSGPSGLELVKGYFSQASQKANISRQLILRSLQAQGSETDRIIREQRTFLNPGWLPSMQGAYAEYANPQLLTRIEEYAYLFQLRSKAQAQVERWDDYIEKTDLVELLLGIGLFLDRIRFGVLKADPTAMNSKLQDWERSVALILTRKKELSGTRFKEINLEREAIIKLFFKILSTYKDNLDTSPLVKILGLYDRLDLVENLIDRYTYLGWKLELSDEGNAFLLPESLKAYQDWNMNGQKYPGFFSYYHNLVQFRDPEFMEALQEHQKPDDVGINFSVRVLMVMAADLGMDSVFDTEELKRVKLLETALIHTNLYHNAKDRHIKPLNQSFRKQINSDDNEWLKGVSFAFWENLKQDRFVIPLFFRGVGELHQMINDVQGIAHRDIANSMKFLSSDFGSGAEVDIEHKPFLRVGSTYFALAEFLGGLRPGIHHFNRVVNSWQKKDKKRHGQWAGAMEEALQRIFEVGGYEAHTGLNFSFYDSKINKERKSEIDVLAYKDETLFVIQHKSTYTRYKISEIYLHGKKALEKAGEQLELSMDYVKKNLEEVMEITGFNGEVKRVFPLISSTSFEFDGQLFNGFEKISLFELRGILHNEARFLYDINHELQKAVGIDELDSLELEYHDGSPEIADRFEKGAEHLIKDKNNPLNKLALKSILWEGEYCPPDRLIECIEKRLFWQMLNRPMQMPVFRLNLNQWSLCHEQTHQEAKNNLGIHFFNKACQLWNDDQEDIAIINFKESLKWDDQLPETWCNLGILQAEKKAFDSAIRCFSKAIKLDPDNWEIYSNRGQAYQDQEDWKKAEQDYTHVLTRSPDLFPERMQRVRVRFKQGKIWEALEDLAHLRTLDLDALTFGLNGGLEIGYHMNQIKAAIPESFDQAMARAEILALMMDWEAALADIIFVVDREPANDRAWFIAGSIKMYNWELAAAAHDIMTAIELNPHEADYPEQLGNTFQRMGANAEALRCFAIAINLDPSFARAWYNASLVAVHQHLYHIADRWASNAILHNPDFLEAWQIKLEIRRELGIDDDIYGIMLRIQEIMGGKDYQNLKKLQDFMQEHFPDAYEEIFGKFVHYYS